jgi:hypothetical protein
MLQCNKILCTAQYHEIPGDFSTNITAPDLSSLAFRPEHRPPAASWAGAAQPLSRQEETLAARLKKATADPIADLLFSPRAAFIWDHTARVLTWLNAAGRSKFGLGAEELQGKLAAPLARCFGAAAKQGKAFGDITLKAGLSPAISCSFEVLELAGGHNGLIVSESADVVRLPDPPKNLRSSSPKGDIANKLRGKERESAKKRPIVKPCAKRKNAPAPGPVRSEQTVSARQLTPEEMHAFKAIGRTVRRLARERQRSANGTLETVPVPPVEPERAAADVQTMQALLFSAFDLVLFLSEELVISQTEGRPQIAGWRKSQLLGQPAGRVLPPPEQTILHRMIKKLRTGSKICRDTLVLQGEAHSRVPCRAVLGHCPDRGTPYFLALVSLELPARLKRQPALPQITRLAA